MGARQAKKKRQRAKRSVQHIQHAAAHTAQLIPEPLRAINGRRLGLVRVGSRWSEPPESQARHIHQAKGAHKDEWKPEEGFDFAVVRLFLLGKYAAMLHDLQIKLRYRGDADVR